MLLVFMGLIDMVGGGPTPPTPSGQGGGEGGHFRDDRGEESKKWIEKLIQDDEDAIWMAGSWLIEKQNN